MPIKCLPSIGQFMYLIFTNVFLIYDRKCSHQFRVNQNKKILKKKWKGDIKIMFETNRWK